MLSLPFQNQGRAAAVLSAAASLAASAMLIRGIASDLLPNELHDFFSSALHSLSRYFSSQFTIVIDEFQGFAVNKLFEAADVYLATRMTPSVRKIKVVKGDEEKKLAVTMDKNEEIVDVFDNVRVKWTLVCIQRQALGRNTHGGETPRSEDRSYELSFNKKYRDLVLNSYLPYVLERSKAIKEENKVVKLHTVNYSEWDSGSILLDHPMTFQTLAMDSELKKALVEDLDNFTNGKDYYRRIGKAWKRGYLLYGPPGTGKSSLIAAMANHLNYDIYDLDLTNVNSNSDLRALLLAMSSKSILVIEDIDCMIKLQNRDSEEQWQQPRKNQQVTLSGLLNFIDGIWSCCGDQGRIIVFSTNHRDRLDPALLRPGRMDMHIHMSYCTVSAFKQLALNYLGVWQHPLFEQVEGLIGEVKVTPAEVAGELIKSKDPDVSLQGLLGFLHSKNEAKTQKDMEAEDRSD